MSVRPDGHSGTAAGSDGLGYRRFLFPGALIVSVMPIWVAVVGYGTRGLFPESDAASTVTRARDVFSAHPPLVGMVAAAASESGPEAHFPGAWQLYVIAVPTRLLGDIWGPLVAMGALNSIWVVLAAWLLSRRLPTAQALVGLLFIGGLLWALGSGFMVTPIPMDMVMIPFVLLCIAAWSVLDGDLEALVVFVIVANYLWLDHLVLVLTVPAIGACAAVGLWLWSRRDRRQSPAEVHAQSKRRLRKRLAVAALITVVMWIPTIIEQLTHQPGNLRSLFTSVGDPRPSIGSWADAAHMVLSVGSRPPFWLRGSLDSPPYVGAGLGPTIVGSFTLFDLLASLVLGGVLVGLAVMARRRGDRTMLTLYAVVGVAVLVSLATTRMAPVYLGVPSGYLRSLWPLWMLVWMAIVLGVLRSLRSEVRESALVALTLVAIGVVAVSNLPRASFGYGTDDRAAQLVDSIRTVVLPRLRDRGQIMVVPAPGITSHHYAAPLMLALAADGVDYCAARRFTLRYGGPPHCGAAATYAVDVRMVADPEHYRKGTVLLEKPYLKAVEQRELADLDRALRPWLGERDHLVLSDRARREFGNLNDSELGRQIDQMLEPSDGGLRDVTEDPLFESLVTRWYGSGTARYPLFVSDPLEPAQWRRWVDLHSRDRTLLVTRSPLS